MYQIAFQCQCQKIDESLQLICHVKMSILRPERPFCDFFSSEKLFNCAAMTMGKEGNL